MTTKSNVLIVGCADRIEILSVNIGCNITFAANYEEATEHLKRREFGLVITDAALKGEETGIQVLEFIKKMARRPRVYLLHTDHRFGLYALRGYIGLHFEDFAEFRLVEELDDWNLNQLLEKCA